MSKRTVLEQAIAACSDSQVQNLYEACLENIEKGQQGLLGLFLRLRREMSKRSLERCCLLLEV